MTTRRQRRERGGALLLVMWMSAALVAIALSVSATIRTETEHTSTMGDGVRAHFLASGSVDRMLTWMSWGPNPGAANQARPSGWSPNVSRYYMQYPSGDAIVETISEASKVNVNTAYPVEILPMVVAVTGNPQQAQQIVNGIMRWRTPGGTAVNLGDFLRPSSTFPPRNASLEEIEELLFVPGVTPEIFYGNYIQDADGRLYARGGLRDVLSVWGTRGKYDVNGAAPALLEGLGLPPAQVQAILARRAQRPFQNLSEVQAIAGSTQQLGVGGISMWTIRANARLRNANGTTSEVVRSAGAVAKVWLDGTHRASPVHVMRYYPDLWSDFAVKPPYVPAGGPR